MAVKANTVDKIATMNLLWCFTSPSVCMFVRNRVEKRVKKQRMLFVMTKIRSENVAGHFLPSLDLCFMLFVSHTHALIRSPLLSVGFIIYKLYW